MLIVHITGNRTNNILLKQSGRSKLFNRAVISRGCKTFVFVARQNYVCTSFSIMAVFIILRHSDNNSIYTRNK